MTLPPGGNQDHPTLPCCLCGEPERGTTSVLFPDQVPATVSHPQLKGKVGRNRNTGTIWVTAPLVHYPPLQPIRITARPAKWAALETRFEKTGTLRLAAIKPYLSRVPRTQRDLLERYANECPEEFGWAIYNHFVGPAACECRVKRPRKPPLGGSWETSAEIKRAARWVYVFLRHWSSRRRLEYPQALTRYLDQRDPYNEAHIEPKAVLGETQWIIEQHFGVAWPEDGDSFLRKHIGEKGQALTRIARALEKYDYRPVGHPLIDIFRL